MNISQLVEKYHAGREEYLRTSYNETQLRNDFLNPFFKLLGWDIDNTEGKATNEREVILEEPVRAHIEESSKKPDYTFRLHSERRFFVEAKKPSVKIESTDEPARQIRRYGFTAKLKISALSNFEHLILYDTSVPVDASDSHITGIIKIYPYTKYVECFQEIKDLIGRDAVYSGSFDEVWKNIEIKLEKFSIDHHFLNQINQWRKELGTEVCKHSPGIKEHLLNDVVQSYLNRILFLRVCEDRNIEQYKTLSKLANEGKFEALIQKFVDADKKYNSGLFDQLLGEKIVANVSSVFWIIIKKLYFPESPYSFSVFSSDILGRIYEIFLAEKLVIKDGIVELVRKPDHLDRDIITTPTYIIHEILRKTVQPKCIGKNETEILKLRFSDIACGSGAFLLEIFQLINDSLIDYYLANDRSKLIQINLSTFKLPFSVKKDILIHCIHGVDKDYSAVEATKFGLLLKLLEGETDSSTLPTKPILPGLENNIHFGNSLIAPADLGMLSDASINPHDFKGDLFDCVVGNPPYMTIEEMQNVTPKEVGLYLKNFKSASKQFDKYYLFVERGLSLLKKDGLLGYIVPSKFTKVGAAKQLRKFLKERKSIVSILSFGANQIFETKSTYTCLLTLSKEPHEEFEYGEVINLAKWRIREKESVTITNKITRELEEDIFVLVPGHLEKAYKKILSISTPLNTLVGKHNIYNGIQTSANDIYIFVPTNEDDKYFYWNELVKGKTKKQDQIIERRIEKDFTKPYFKTLGKNSLHSYKKLVPNSRVLYPYEPNAAGEPTLISLNDIKARFPLAYDYLIEHQPVLSKKSRKIQPVPKTTDEWHRYGRSHGLSSCEVPLKIVVGILSSGEKYAIDESQTLVSSGGTAGYCCISFTDENPYSIYYVQAILNSKYLEWFCSLYGEIFNNKYLARGTKVLERLPIRQINFENPTEKNWYDLIIGIQKKLIRLNEQMISSGKDKRAIAPLLDEFNRGKQILDTALTSLYELGEDDALIPTIEELYEAD